MDPKELLSGPRGRRLLLEYANLSEQVTRDYDEGSLLYAVMHAAHQLDPGRGTSRIFVSIGGDNGDMPSVTAEEVAHRLDHVDLVEVTDDRLRLALAASVDSARYYQEPDGEDSLTATLAVKHALGRIADHIADSPLTDWWTTDIARDDQWAVSWTDDPNIHPNETASETLALWRHRVPINEEEARNLRPDDPTANHGGEWWSIPPILLTHSTRTLFDATPAGLWYAEDIGGMDHAWVHKLRIDEHFRVLEIDGADAWADLCRKYPLEVTAQKRHDWYRATGRDGRWLVPDWQAVADDYDGVHLTVAGYLAASGTVIQVDDACASLISAWNPDQTWWLTDVANEGESQVWTRTYSDGYPKWTHDDT